MKVKYLFLLPIIIFALSLYSCGDEDEPITSTDPNPSETKTDNEIANEWILDEMSEWYYWSNKLPDKNSLNFKLDPGATNGFFETILFSKNKANRQEMYDKFSWIESYTANTKSASKSDLGFDFFPVTFIDGAGKPTGDYGNVVVYIKKGTLAEKSGLKRGHIITAVDGIILNKDNWYSALYANKSIYELDVIDNEIKKEIKISSPVTPAYDDKYVLMDTVYKDISGHKIGYLVFNTYGTEGDASDLQNNIYLIQRLTDLQKAGITDLVLDLRYNMGGLVTTGVHLGSALVPNRIDDIYEIKKYNDVLQRKIENSSNDIKEDWLYDRFREKILWDDTEYNNIPKLGDQLQTLCILTTGYTASCSEMTINCLKPYYTKAGKNLYVVGEQTTGKNVGSWTIEPENKDIKWKLQPITFQSFNVDKESNYFNGFFPDQAADDYEDLKIGLKPLGDLEETLLAKAVSKITGIPNSKSTKTKGPSIVKSFTLDQIEKAGKRSSMIINMNEVKKIKTKLAVLELGADK
ncbi:hypothetical protein JGH11_08045 [Dysgonomonas sp. Marseille-P4677]|uniref:S41 family peptidase n=1 Tax=Dysgonomonas sp. Marseille-P4677 TaxID=2364790 RepID=UPI001911C67A|nr:S41 family peptidase [Dysgonomonas sp. Marseille-P4677]MBK5720822.1 hypothetical protein [Dysgonomonas sp. Marseille-P4677]